LERRVARRLHLVQVGPGGERLARSGDDDRAHGGIGHGRFQRLARLADQLRGQRVADLGAVEDDPARRAFRLGADDDGGVRHPTQFSFSSFTDSKTSTGTSSSMRKSPWASVLPWWSTRSDSVPPPPSASLRTKFNARRFAIS